MKRSIFCKLRDMLTLRIVGARNAADEIKQDEQAMEVIQVVMLIAVGVIAIAAVWAGVNGLLEQWWNMITGSSGGSGGPSLTP